MSDNASDGVSTLSDIQVGNDLRRGMPTQNSAWPRRAGHTAATHLDPHVSSGQSPLAQTAVRCRAWHGNNGRVSEPPTRCDLSSVRPTLPHSSGGGGSAGARTLQRSPHSAQLED